MAKNGLDPSLERKKAQRAIPTFEEAARRYHETVKASWRNGKRTDQWLSTLVAHAFPTIGAIRVDHIDAPTVQSVLLPIWLTLPRRHGACGSESAQSSTSRTARSGGPPRVRGTRSIR